MLRRQRLALIYGQILLISLIVLCWGRSYNQRKKEENKITKLHSLEAAHTKKKLCSLKTK